MTKSCNNCGGPTRGPDCVWCGSPLSPRPATIEEAKITFRPMTEAEIEARLQSKIDDYFDDEYGIDHVGVDGIVSFASDRAHRRIEAAAVYSIGDDTPVQYVAGNT